MLVIGDMVYPVYPALFSEILQHTKAMAAQIDRYLKTAIEPWLNHGDATHYLPEGIPSMLRLPKLGADEIYCKSSWLVYFIFMILLAGTSS